MDGGCNEDVNLIKNTSELREVELKPLYLTKHSGSSMKTELFGKFWFQLYHPAENALRDDIMDRAEAAGCDVLVLLCDVPSFGYRPRDIRNGLAMPPKMTFQNILQIMGKPNWALNTLWHGQPHFATMKKYMPKGLNMSQLGAYRNQTFAGLILRFWAGRLCMALRHWAMKAGIIR